MKSFIIALTLALFTTIGVNAQDYNYQGYVKNSSGTDSVRASFYIAGNQFDPLTVFNSSNYPVWFKENVTLQVDNGILNYRMVGVDVDSLVEYRGQLYLYVTINGSPFDKVIISSVPYATYSDLADNSKHSLSSDTSTFALASFISQRAFDADTAVFSQRTLIADSSVNSSVASLSITSLNAIVADSAFTISDDGVTEEKIAPNSITPVHFKTINSASNQTALSYIDGNFVWATRDYINTTTVEKSLVVPTSINSNTLYFISQVAQDYSIVEPTPRYGRIIRIVNASTANTIQVNWNTLFGGSVFISPRSSVEFMYVNSEWIKL
jgi:hypothetical protein